ncbi:modular serine protease-like [Arctopsyche grandis]|uniref:modular serine protease-like n=1 Tax=Arctopsyche grandis TaxID=121162 RepID=UPI00406D6628
MVSSTLSVLPLLLLLSASNSNIWEEGNRSSLLRNCFAPPRLEHGYYLINGKTVSVASNISHYSVLTYFCDDVYSKTGGEILYCRPDGTWNSYMECTKLCEPPRSLTVDFTCALRGDYVNCSKPMKNGTIVNLSCKPHHTTYTNRQLNTLTCIKGRWDKALNECAPDCGQENGVGARLVIGGQIEHRKFSPWHLGVYKYNKNNGTYEQFCGGTIITRNIVISAAHCFDFPGDENLYAVAAGKIYRQWDHQEKDQYDYIQNSSVKAIHIPRSYLGNRDYYQLDVAMLLLKTPFEFSNEVHAACLDINDGDFYEYLLTSTLQGKVVGWGITKEGDTRSSSKMLLRADVKVIGREDCLKSVPEEFIPHVTTNKICITGADKNMTLCNGDSGGGSLVKVPIKGTFRWYLIGVISTGALGGPSRDTCLANSSTVVTSLYNNRKFILDAFDNYDRYSQFVEPALFTTEVSTTPVPGIPVDCVLPPYPENGSYNVIGNDLLSPGDRVQVLTVLNFTCQVNYTLNGSHNSTCGNDGIWSRNVQCNNSICEDDPFFANCQLIVRAKYCSHKYYARFCCDSCTAAGQISP